MIAESAYLAKVILHDISDDPKLVKVAASAVGAERLLEADLHIGDEVAVPCGRQKLVGKPVSRKGENLDTWPLPKTR